MIVISQSFRQRHSFHENYSEIKSKKGFHLKKISSRLASRYSSANDYEEKLKEHRSKIEEYQTLLYASHSRAILIIFQGMDTAGKNGAIKHVMAGVNPQGCSVISFKTPTSHELDHDFLWRVNRVLPVRGLIGIFNRSYYEEVLVPKVHPKLLKTERLPGQELCDPHFWKHRYQDINHYESYLNRQGYDLIKIFIHISKKEQKIRLLERFADPHKHWKISQVTICFCSI